MASKSKKVQEKIKLKKPDSSRANLLNSNTEKNQSRKISKKAKKRLKISEEKEARKKLLEENQKKGKIFKQQEIKKKVQENVLKISSAASEVLNSTTANLEKNGLKGKFDIFFSGVRKFIKFFKWPLIIILSLFLILIIAAITVYLIYSHDLPDVTHLKSVNLNETTTIYDREGNVLYKIFGEENREYVPLKNIDSKIVEATIAIEDKNFYKHFGFDPVGMVRAQLNNLRDDAIIQGASTITQQLAKNIYLSREQTLDRKIKELVLSLQIEWLYAKDEILEMYLNKIPYGSNAYGIEAAAKTFFGKSAKDLSLVEASILASLPKGPSKYSPYGPNKKELMGYCDTGTTDQIQNLEDPADVENRIETSPNNINQNIEEAPNTSTSAKTDTIVCISPDDSHYIKGRKDFVLYRLLEDKKITKDQLLEAWQEGFKIQFKEIKNTIKDEHFVFFVKEYLENKYGKEFVENGGLDVVTTLDPKLQQLGQKVIDDFYDVNLKKYGANNGAMVALDPKTGQILAMVGSKDYWDINIQGQNNVVTSLRQPGSAFKPLVYAAAIENAGIGSGTYLNDYKTAFTDSKKVPNNYDGKFQGKMTIRMALGGSRNIPAIKAFYVGGDEEKILDFMDKIGIKNLREFKNNYNKKLNGAWTFNFGWPMAIGSGEIKLLDLTNAYATLSNQGRYIAANPIMEVRDRHGNIIEKFDPNYKGEQVMSAETAFIVSDMLADPLARPAGTWRNILAIPGQTIAAKTGTSDKKIGKVSLPNNTLTVGYSTTLAASFWVGNTDGHPLNNSAYSLYTTDPLWNKFFTEALKDKPKEDFPVPPGIKKVGKEYYPSFWNKKDYDKMFKRLDAPKECTPEELLATPDKCIKSDPKLSTGTTNVPERPKVPPKNKPTGSTGSLNFSTEPPAGSSSGDTPSTSTNAKPAQLPPNP